MGATTTSGAKAMRPRTASLLDTLAVLAEVLAPTFAKGVIVRRPRVTRLSERLGLDGRAVRRLQILRDRYGPGPVLLKIPVRNQAVVLSPEDARRVLLETPDPFSPASSEKRAALSHFEAHVSLVSEGPEREARKRLNDAALQSGREAHALAPRFAAVVGEEMRALLAERRGGFHWADFNAAWHRAARRIVLGDAARDDRDLTDALAKLRAAANWAFLHPGRKRLREGFHRRLGEHLARAEPGSLAEVVAREAGAAASEPVHQVAHWLFAFEPAGMATLRALALLAAHPEAMARARAEAREAPRERLPFLRAAVLESLRLWPTTPAILRQSRAETAWGGGVGAVLPEGTGFLIFVPFFHRDGAALPYADRFHPEVWLEGGGWPLIPFSAGPGLCPAHHLVPMLGSMALAALLEGGGGYALDDPARLDAARPMPGLLDALSLAFRATAA